MGGGYSPRVPRSAQCERELDADDDGHGLAEGNAAAAVAAPARARAEAPLLHRDDRLLIEAERRVERSRDLDAARIDRAVGEDDRFHLDDALQLRAHRIAGVVRLHFLDQHGVRDAVARLERAAAEPAA